MCLSVISHRYIPYWRFYDHQRVCVCVDLFAWKMTYLLLKLGVDHPTWDCLRYGLLYPAVLSLNWEIASWRVRQRYESNIHSVLENLLPSESVCARTLRSQLSTTTVTTVQFSVSDTAKISQNLNLESVHENFCDKWANSRCDSFFYNGAPVITTWELENIEHSHNLWIYFKITMGMLNVF